MRFLLAADTHVTDKNPEFRVDDYPLVQLKKFEWVFQQARDHNCNAILIAGDIFDKPTISIPLFARYVDLFFSAPCPVLTVYGQHDQKYRRRENTFLFLLALLGCVKILSPDEPDIFYTERETFDEIHIYGASWNEMPVEPIDEEAFNILVTHRRIFKKEQTHDFFDYETAYSFLRRNPNYDLVVSGDNHQRFYEKYKESDLINPGSLVRKAIDQRDYEPAIIIYDTQNTYWEEFVPIEKIDVVMDVERADYISERNLFLEEFVSGIRERYDFTADIVSNLVLAIGDASPEVRAIVNDLLIREGVIK